jgi:hypothetical protein
MLVLVLEAVVVLLGCVKGERVLEAGATTAANRDAQRLIGAVLLPTEQLLDLGRRLVGQLDRLKRLTHRRPL